MRRSPKAAKLKLAPIKLRVARQQLSDICAGVQHGDYGINRNPGPLEDGFSAKRFLVNQDKTFRLIKVAHPRDDLATCRADIDKQKIVRFQQLCFWLGGHFTEQTLAAINRQLAGKTMLKLQAEQMALRQVAPHRALARRRGARDL